MALVVDTCVLLDVRMGDPVHGPLAAGCLQARASEGLVVCPVTLIELAPAFHGDLGAQRTWLEGLGFSTHEPWLEADTALAHDLWHAHIQRKRSGASAKRPVADVLIAAFASRFDGLITRNAVDFKNAAPHLPLVVP